MYSPPGAGHAAHLTIDERHVRHIARADRLDDEIELSGSEGRQVIHRRFDDADVQPTLRRDLSIEREHLRADVDHGHLGAGGRVEGALPSTPGGQAQQSSPGDTAIEPRILRDNAGRLRDIVVAAGVVKRCCFTTSASHARRLCSRAAAMALACSRSMAAV